MSCHARRLWACVLAVVFVLSAFTVVGAPATAAGARGGDADRDRPAPGARGAQEVGAKIAGLVYNVGGRLLDDIKVEAVAFDDPLGDPVATALTYESGSAAHGAYELNVPSGDYFVRFSSLEDAEARVYETLYYGGGQGSRVTVGTQQAQELTPVTLVVDAGATLDGRVIGAQAQGIANVSVTLNRFFSDGEVRPVDWTSTNSTGNYSFEGVNHGRRYSVFVNGTVTNDGDRLGLPNLWLGMTPVAADAQTVLVAEGEAGRSVADVLLETGVDVSGRVVDAQGASPDGVAVELLVRSDSGVYESLRTDYIDGQSEGAYGFTSLARNATYTVRFEQHVEAVYLGDALSEGEADTFSTTTDAATIELGVTNFGDRYSTLWGSAVDRDGDRVVGATLILWVQRRDGSFDDIQFSRTGAEDFDLQAGWGRTYTVEVRPDDGPGVFLGGASSPEEAETVTAGPDRPEVTLAPIVLDVVWHKFVGRVVHQSTPVAGASVALLGRECDECDFVELREGVTDAEGRYAFGREGGQDWAYTIRAEGRGLGMPAVYAGQVTDADQADVFVFDSEPRPVNIPDIELQLAQGVVRGSLSTETGTRVPNGTTIRLWTWTASGWTSAGVVNSERERYAFYDVEPGSYTLEFTRTAVHAGGWLGGSQPPSPDAEGVFEVVAGAGLTEVPPMVLPRGVELAGTVTGTNGQPLSMTTVEIWDRVESDPSVVEGSRSQVVTDEAGRYSIRVPNNSELGLAAFRSGYEAFIYSADGSSSGPTTSSLVTGDVDMTYDVTMRPEWHTAPAIERLEYCLAHQANPTVNISRGGVRFGDRKVQIWGDGRISTDVDAGLLGALDDSRYPILAPFTGGGHAHQAEWGTSPDGRTLCALWRDRPDGAEFQALVHEGESGEASVTYNYGTIPAAADPATRAGHTTGDGAFGEASVFPGFGDGGYADGSLTGLATTSHGSSVPGRHVFTFDGFNKLSGPVPSRYPTIQGNAWPGEVLTIDPGTWTVDHGSVLDPARFEYEWVHASGAPNAESYVVQPEDADRGWIQVRVWASAPGRGWSSEYQHVAVLEGPPAAHNERLPWLSQDTPSVGETLTVDVGEWTVPDGTMDDLSWTYKWFRNGNQITGETSPTYEVREADAARAIHVRVAARREGYSRVRVQSPRVQVEALLQVPMYEAPVVTGLTRIGETLTVDPGNWAPEGVDVTHSYRWAVGHQTRASDADSQGREYTLSHADRHRFVTVYVTARAPGFRDNRWTMTVGPVADAGESLGNLTIDVVADADGEPIEGAWVSICEDGQWTCLPGATTGPEGRYDGVAWSAETYDLHVFSKQDALRDARVQVTMPESGNHQVEVRLTSTTPPPANVSIPTAQSTYQGEPQLDYEREQIVDVTGCATTPAPQYTVTFLDEPESQPRTGPMTLLAPSGAGLATFRAQVPPLTPHHGRATFATNLPGVCGESETTELAVYIDPSGIVTDQYGRPLVGASVTLLRSAQAGGPFVSVPNGSPLMSDANRANPTTTDAQGFFRWDVVEGWYRVRAEAPGCTSFTSDPMQVSPPRVDLLLKLTCAIDTPGVLPTIGGDPVVGQVLSADVEGWPGFLDVQVRWQRDGVAIPGATAATYAVIAEDVDHHIAVEVSGVRPSHVQEEGRGVPVTFASVTRTSDELLVRATPPQGPGSPTPAAVATSPPVVSGSGKVGSRLVASSPEWDRTDVVTTWQWLRDGQAIAGATSSSYDVQAADVDRRLLAQAVGTRAGATPTISASEPITGLKGDPATAPTPRLFGSAIVGEDLTVEPPLWDHEAVADTTRWLRNGEPIEGAVGTTYSIVPEDLGATLSAAVTGTIPGHVDGEVRTADVVVGVGASPQVAEPPRILGRPAVGRVLRVFAGGWDTDVSLDVSWTRDGRVLPDADGLSYRVRPADAGRHLAVVVTASSPGRADGRATSATVKVSRLESNTKIKAGDRTVRRGGAAKLVIHVTAVPLASPTGEVVVFRGDAVVTKVVLRTSDTGRAVVTVDGLAPGRHRFSAVYRGEHAVRGSRSGTVTVKVRP